MRKKTLIEGSGNRNKIKNKTTQTEPPKKATNQTKPTKQKKTMRKTCIFYSTEAPSPKLSMTETLTH